MSIIQRNVTVKKMAPALEQSHTGFLFISIAVKAAGSEERAAEIRMALGFEDTK